MKKIYLCFCVFLLACNVKHLCAQELDQELGQEKNEQSVSLDPYAMNEGVFLPTKKQSSNDLFSNNESGASDFLGSDPDGEKKNSLDDEMIGMGDDLGLSNFQNGDTKNTNTTMP